MCSVLRGWCSAGAALRRGDSEGDGGIERDGDRGFSALGGDGEDGRRERDGSQ